MKNLKVSYKLIVSFIITIAFSATIGVVGIVGMNSINNSSNIMYYSHTEPLANVASASEFVQRIRVALRNAVLYTGTDKAVSVQADIKERIDEFENYMNDFRPFIIKPDTLKLFDNTLNMFEKDFMPRAEEIAVMSVAGADMSVLLEKMEDTGTYADTLRDNLAVMVDTKLENASMANEANKELYDMLLVIIIAALTAAVAISVFLAFYISGLISKPLVVLSSFMNKAGSTGDIALSAEDSEAIDKYSKIKDEIGRTISGASSFIAHVTNIAKNLETVAGGDLTADANLLSDADTMGKALKAMTDNLNKMFEDVKASTMQVAVGTTEISNGAQSLAQGSTEQAAVAQQLSSSVTEISAKTAETADMAGQAAKLSLDIKHSADVGSARMDEMVVAVHDINQASHNIDKVIKVIDDIAFQTNLLALNAAVEAARAGQAGKGFAVVAEEVRNLAAKSAEAAKNTEDLIADSIEKADLGAKIAGETAASLAEIVNGVVESTTLVERIAKASESQNSDIQEINKGIDQVVQVIQQNSATAEESAAASQEMSSQASMLEQLVEQFKLRGTAAATRAALHSSDKRVALPGRREYVYGERELATAGNFGKY